ncbi:MAG: hypothetical protein K0U52_00330 [Gammaproteobacteria bacterium]|nr:hypothetical protein [Gammaproteobacteria bacterium]
MSHKRGADEREDEDLSDIPPSSIRRLSQDQIHEEAANFFDELAPDDMDDVEEMQQDVEEELPTASLFSQGSQQDMVVYEDALVDDDVAVQASMLEDPPPTPVMDRIESDLQDMDVEIDTDDLGNATFELYQRWVEYPRNHIQNMSDAVYKLYGLQRTTMGLTNSEIIDEKHVAYSFPVIRLYRRLVKERFIGDDTETCLVNNRIMRILQMIFNARAIIQMDQNSRQCIVSDLQENKEDINLENWTFRFIDTSDNTPYQSSILYLLECAYNKNFRRYGGKIYSQVMTQAGPGQVSFKTHAWRETMEIPSFIYSHMDKESHFEQWQHFTSQRDMVRTLTTYLLDCTDPEFPELKPNRHVFSFTNGLYHAKEMGFYPYGDANKPIPTDLVAAKFFDNRFPEEFADGRTLFRDIPTPNLDKVLDHQLFSSEPYDPNDPHGLNIPPDETPEEKFNRTRFLLSVKDWILVFMGRMIYDINDQDQWQTIMFLKGVAGSGKSTLGKVISNLYDPADVGVLSNNIEKKFGLGSIVDKLIYLCYEVKQDFGVDQGEFQSMISGEPMSIPRKFETAISKNWSSHGFLMGNEVANWVDNSGSMCRRIVLGDFTQQVTQGDPQLFDKLVSEMPAIILKINMAYRLACDMYGKQNIYEVLPPYFEQQRKSLRNSTNALYAFLDSDEVELGPDQRWLYQEYKDTVNYYTKQNGCSVKWSTDNTRTIYEAYNLKVVTEEVDGMRKKFIVGVGPRLACIQNE